MKDYFVLYFRIVQLVLSGDFSKKIMNDSLQNSNTNNNVTITNLNYLSTSKFRYDSLCKHYIKLLEHKQKCYNNDKTKNKAQNIH